MEGTNTRPVGAERAVLGNLLLTGGGSLSKVEELLTGDSWATEQHRNIYSWVVDRSHGGKPISPMAIVESAGTEYLLNAKYGGAEYLHSLPTHACVTPSIAEWGAVVAEGAKMRQLQEECERTLTLIKEGEEPASELLKDTERRVLNISTVGSRASSVTSMRDVSNLGRARAERIADGDILVEYVPSYFPSFDEHYTGWPRGWPSYIGGRSKMGKTMFVLSSAIRGADPLFGGVSVPQGFVSIEMPGSKLLYRMAATKSGVPWSRLRNQVASVEEREAFFQAIDEIGQLPIWVDDSVNSLEGVCSAITRMSRVHGCPIVYLDYFQLVKGGGRNAGETAGWDAIGDELRAIAKREDIALVILSQLNQKCETRKTNGRLGVPAAGDFRGTEKMLFDAGIAAGVYREFHYHHPKKIGGSKYTEQELGARLQPLEFIAVGTRDDSRKDIELFVRMDVGQVFDPKDEGFIDPEWARARRFA